MKKVLKEQEPALQLNSDDDDSGSPVSSRPTRNPFDLLEDDNDDITSSRDDDHSDQVCFPFVLDYPTVR